MNASPRSLPELLAPAGNWDCAKAAVENGADAIYFGLERFNARMRADNFTQADLPELMAFLHGRAVKGYLTLNTLIFPEELAEAEDYLRAAIGAGVDAAIVQDVGICRLIRHLSPDFPIHASTQMTVTSAAGVAWARELGCEVTVLARECSIADIEKIQRQLKERQIAMPLEVFVHGALCVAYSGQCLTSEALGGRSANRGECAQACRMPYELVVDGKTMDLGDRKYLLSPQDLAGLEVLPELVKAGVSSLKIEGRLKAPEYVASVTRVYRQALNRIGESEGFKPETEQRYDLEMAFSRGLYPGWFNGINNQELVLARFGKKRGAYLGEVRAIARDSVKIRLETALKPGDGVVFDRGQPELKEEGGRVYAVRQEGQEAVVAFGRRDIDWRRVRVGDKLWKTSDPELDKRLRQSFAGDTPRFQRPISLEVSGEVGQNLIAVARDELGYGARAESAIPLAIARNQPLTDERLRQQFGRLGNTAFELKDLTNRLKDAVMLPTSELNRMRREIVAELERLRRQPQRWQLRPEAQLREILPDRGQAIARPPELSVLIRNLEQLHTVLAAGIATVYCDFEDPRNYREAVQIARQQSDAEIWVAPPRVAKPGENYLLQQVRGSKADGYLLRNADHLQFFAGDRARGDFSFNIANPLSADYFKQSFNLERLTASYDLNIEQLEALLQASPASWYEITLHQHMPMFHMEHCVFCAFLSDGTDYTNCGRPCEKHEVKLRDLHSKGKNEHLLQADAGCRNTVFNSTAQTGAEYLQRLLALGARDFRIEFLNESCDRILKTLHLYRQLLNGEISGSQLWRELRLQSQLGVTRGSLGRVSS